MTAEPSGQAALKPIKDRIVMTAERLKEYLCQIEEMKEKKEWRKVI